jgi:hypothetical protein
VARALSEAGNTDEACRQYRVLLNDPAKVRDEQGVGFRFYAAERLLATKRDVDAVRSFLSNEINGEGRLTLPELYMIRSLPGSPPDLHTRQKTSERIAEMEQAAALANSFPRVRAPIWVPYGNEPWLVTVTSPQPPLPGLVVAVSSARVMSPHQHTVVGLSRKTRQFGLNRVGSRFDIVKKLSAVRA